LIILPDEIHDKFKALEGGCLHWHFKKLILIIISEENHENLRAFEGCCLHCYVKKAYIGTHS
jgi:hypothetical protein